MADPIAIVGSACRFPGAVSSLSKLWNLLREPRDILSDSGPEFRRESGVFNNDDDRANLSYLLREDFRRFDAAFFKINKKEADAMDPQNRILLETVYEAIESAGLPLSKAKGSLTSVHVGVMTADHSDIQMRDPETLQTYAATGLARSMLANRISYFFDFKGPSETVDTACSSSLVALHHAVRCIQAGDANQAIVAGSALLLDSAMYIAESKLHMLSPSSRSRMWDQNADGYSRGEGCAAILIKPLSKAIEDGDSIECVIRATGVNSDGRTSGITMPSTKAQIDLIRHTYHKAGLDPVQDRCQYFECHGTGTPAGDPVEAAAIQQALFSKRQPLQDDENDKPPLYCGSIKTVLGHLEGCAGLAGILKASLAIQHQVIPPNLHFNNLNPKIKHYYHDLCVPTSLVQWPRVGNGPLRASVNSFGFGGTNAHAILESYDASHTKAAVVDSSSGKTAHMKRSLGLFVFSAESEASLLGYLKRMSEYLRCNPYVDPDALEWTLCARRSSLAIRTYMVASDQQTLLQRLEEKVHVAEVDDTTPCGIRAAPEAPGSPPKILAIFTGQGAQWTNMGRELILNCPTFRASLERCEEALAVISERPSWSLMDVLVNGDSLPVELPAEIAQPICTAIQIALIDLLRAIGIDFSAVLGHSSGEIAAAYAVGILSARDAMSISYYRGSVVHQAASLTEKKGGMMVVGVGFDEAVELCSMSQFRGRLDVAASNAPSNVTLSGDKDALYEAKQLLEERNIFTNVLRVNVPYHSRHMLLCAERYASFLQQLDIEPQPARSQFVWYSSVQDRVNLVHEEASQFKCHYWVDNMVKPVVFHTALQATLEQCPNFDVALEVGPHPAMKISVRDSIKNMQKAPLHYIGCLERMKNDVEALTATLGYLWCCFGDENVNLKNWRMMRGRITQPAPLRWLPAYVWDHENVYWKVSCAAQRPVSKKHPPHELLGRLYENLKDDVTWRNVFSQEDIPWLKGHVLHGQVVFPAAGYVSMAAQAAYQLTGDCTSIEFQNVKIRRPLIIPEGSDGVETLFKVKIRDHISGIRNQSVLKATFTCYSGSAGGDLSKTCEGQFLVRGQEDSLTSFPQSTPKYSTQRNYLPPVDPKRWFTALAELGIAYDGVFRALNSLNRIWGSVDASAAWQEMGLDCDYLIHPALLDVGFQIGFATFASLARSTTAAAVPTEIRRIVLYDRGDFNQPLRHDSIDLQAHLVKAARANHTVNIDIYDSYTKNVRMQIDGLVIRTVAEPGPSEDRQIFAKTVWDVDVAHGFPVPPAITVTDQELEYIDAVERTSFFYLRSICREFPRDARKEVKHRYQTMLNGLDILLDPLQKEQRVVIKQEWLDDDSEYIEKLSGRFPNQVDLALLSAVGRNLPSVIRGESEILEHMMKDDLLSRLYSEGRGFTNCNQNVAFLMKKLAFKFPRAKILEIGAGTGGTTCSVLDAIGSAFLSYTYTDLSSGFFEKAAKRFRDHAHRMEFKCFNVETLPTTQGFTEGSFDIIIAANVLHATRHISQAVRHVRSLLRPGGFLIGVEVTGNMLRETGLMAGLEGWWLGVNDGRFPLPGISVQQWDDLLSASNFSGIDSVTYDCSDISKHNCSVFVSLAVDGKVASSLSSERITVKPSVLIIGGHTKVAEDSALQAKVFSQLHTPHVAVAAGLDSLDLSMIDSSINVLCLTELDKPIFSLSIPHEASLKNLQQLLQTAANIVWVTSGGYESDPYANMMPGIGRSLAFEIPNMNIQFINFDESSRLDMKLVVESLFQMIYQSSCRANNPATRCAHEPELRVKNNEVLIPRLVSDQTANNLLNATRRHISEKRISDTVIDCSMANSSEFSRPEKRQLESAHQAHMRVHRSLSLNSGRGTPLYLCFGQLIGHSTMSIALSDTEAPVVNHHPDDIQECPSWYHCDNEGLTAFGSALVASYLLESSPLDVIVVVHEAPLGVAEALVLLADARGREVILTGRTVHDLHATESYVRYSNPWLERHRPTIYQGGTLWLFSDDGAQNALAYLTGSCSIRRFSASNITLKNVKIAEALKVAQTVRELAAPVDANVGDGPRDLRRCARLPTVVEWQPIAPVHFTIHPLNVNTILSATRTYFLVGMASDLGHSLCRFLVYHGVKHIALASRTVSKSEPWVARLTALGTNIRMFNMDVTKKAQVDEVVASIRRTMPPLAGVANAALVLEDSLFINTTPESIERQLKPKTEGTLHLHEVFSKGDLDFFVAFSSLGTVYGNAGQSVYHAANLFMTSLVEKRRRNGLPASVLSLGMVVDVGFVARAQRNKGTIEQHLESKFYTPLAETEFHFAFAQAIVASHPQSSSGDVTVGIQPYIDMPDSRKPPWHTHPRFSHMIASAPPQGEQQNNAVEIDSRATFMSASSQSAAEEAFMHMFCKKIEIMIRTPADQMNIKAPLADLGLDSLLAVDIRKWLLEYIGIDVPLLGILGHESISSIMRRVWDESTLLRKSGAYNETSLAASENHLKPLLNGSKHTRRSSAILKTDVVTITTDKSDVLMPCEQMGFAQSSMYFMQTVSKDPTMFNVTAEYSIRGLLDVDRFLRALSATLLHHEAYQTRFYIELPHQRTVQALFHPNPSAPRHEYKVARNEDVQRTFLQFANHQYVLSEGHTFQAVLITQSAELHTFIFGCHHIIMDGASWNIFLRDLDRAYQMLTLQKSGQTSFDFARCQHEDVANGVFEESIKYWLHELDPLPPVLPPLPLALRTRQDFQHRYDIHTARWSFKHDEITQIATASKNIGVTTMHFYLAAIATLFARLLELDEICIGVTDAGRGRFTDIVGHFTNLLPIRLQIDHEKSFEHLLRRTSQTVRQGAKHKCVPFELLLEKLSMPRSSRAAPLFQLAFNFRVGDLLNVKMGDCSMELERYRDAKTPFDFVFNVTQTDSGHLVEVTSNSLMYSSTTTQLIIDTYIHMVQKLSATPSINVGDRRLHPKAQVENALSLGRGARVHSKWPATLIERFNQVCDLHPDTVAIQDHSGRLTYSELSDRVHALAAAISTAGILTGDHVAVMCEPSVDLFAAMLGILHLGAVFVPLDITVPTARNIAMAAVCQPKLVMYDTTNAEMFEQLFSSQYQLHSINLSDVPPKYAGEISGEFQDYAFLLFTSGSTGTPKGVKITQSGVMNYVESKSATLCLGKIRVLQQSSIGFDMSLAQAFNAFANAGTLIIAPSKIRGDPAPIANLIQQESIQFTICTPTEYSTLTAYATDTLRKCKSWQYGCSGGEVLTESLLSELRRLDLPGFMVVDCYGPTELSCATTLNKIPLNSKRLNVDSVHVIGKPIPNTSVYIGGPDSQPLPVGFPGEICVGGIGVSMGYVGAHADPGKFLFNALAKYQQASSDFNTVYRTGDKGCLREDGTLILMGRIDGETTVKLRGLRVDLSEVANSIVTTAKGIVTNAVVTVRGNPEFLIAHVVLAEKNYGTPDTFTTLRSKLPLPQYMIPSQIVPLARLPITTNGKVDRKAIAEMPLPRLMDDHEHQKRLNVSEGELQLIWKEVLGECLGAATIGPETDFFVAGGSSLLLLKLQNAIKERMGVSLELRSLYQSSTLRKMAAAANSERSRLVSEAIDWDEETGLTQELLNAVHTTELLSPKQEERVVGLTGATGFLGSHILRELIVHPDVSRIHCIAVPFEAKNQIPKSSKVIVHRGSLASPSLGLSASEMEILKLSMDQIIHAGAQGHCLNNYSSVRAANYTSTQKLALLAVPRKIPFHFISSPRVLLLSGSHTAPPQSLSHCEPPRDGSEGFTSSKWASEVYLENAARMMELPVTIHRPCSLIGSGATHDDALNSVIRFSQLSHTVPSISNAHGFFDFRDVEQVAAEIVNRCSMHEGLSFLHHSSGIKLPFNELASRMEQLYGGNFTTIEMEGWIDKAVALGLDNLIVAYLRDNILGSGKLDFPYLGSGR